MPFPDTAADHYLERLVKFAPTEVIGAYAVVMAMLLSPSNELHVPALLWVVFAAFLIATPFYLQTVVRVLRVQALFSAVAFAAWALILPGPFATIPHYDPVYGALAFIVVNFLLPLLYPGARTE